LALVIGVAAPGTSIVLADSRLSCFDRNGNVVAARDVCQKLFLVGDWAVIGFAGGLCFGKDIVGGLLQRLDDEGAEGPVWLNRQRALLGFLQRRSQEHRVNCSTGRECVQLGVEVLICYRGRVPLKRHGASGSGGVFAPTGAFVPSHVVRVPRWLKARAGPQGVSVGQPRIGLDAIGSGSTVLNDLVRHEKDIFAWAAGKPYEAELRVAFLLQLVSDALCRAPIPTVGTVFHAAALEPSGARFISYWRFLAVRPGYGTWILVRAADGDLVQEHRPTARQVRIADPRTIPTRGIEWNRGCYEPFDVAGLKPSSPGVVREGTGRPPGESPAWQCLFSPFKGPEIPSEVQCSWGADAVS
jgi:hypothetical protein